MTDSELRDLRPGDVVRVQWNNGCPPFETMVTSRPEEDAKYGWSIDTGEATFALSSIKELVYRPPTREEWATMRDLLKESLPILVQAVDSASWNTAELIARIRAAMEAAK